MAIEILADLGEIDRPQWLELRKLGIGGSDAGAVCGIDGRRSPYDVWAEKVNPSPARDDEDEPEYMSWGKLLEAPVRDEFVRRTGIEVHPLPKVIRNTDYPWMLANVDGVTGPSSKLEGVYEGKTTRFAGDWQINDDGSVTVPLRAAVQGMHYLAVLGLERIHFACLIAGQELRIAEMERDEVLVADLIKIEEAFWRSVIEREPPPVGASDVPLLKKRWTPEEGKTIELLGTYIPTLKVRAQKKVLIKGLEEDVNLIDAELMQFMGDAEVATFEGKPLITWKGSKRSTLNKAAMLAAHPELEAIVAEFTETTESRRFLPKEIAQ